MNYILWFTENRNIYWHGIVIAAAIGAAVIAAAGFRAAQGKRDNSVLMTAAVGIPLAFFLSRLVFWYFAQEFFSGFASAFELNSSGGFSLLGAMLGIFAAMLVTKAALRLDDLTSLLDAAAPAAALGICIGRLSGYFSLDDRGLILETESRKYFPFGVYDAANDNWRLSVFALESIAAGVIFIACTVMFAYVYSDRSRIRSGNVFLLFLSLFGITQGTLESMRLDSLFMNTLGFVRVMQIASLVFIVFVLAVYSVTSIKHIGFRLLHILAWLVSLGLLGLAFYMEFRIHSAVLMRNYAVMLTCLSLAGYISFRLFALTYCCPRSDRGIYIRIGRKTK